jgi:hypothetical protein
LRSGNWKDHGWRPARAKSSQDSISTNEPVMVPCNYNPSYSGRHREEDPNPKPVPVKNGRPYLKNNLKQNELEVDLKW